MVWQKIDDQFGISKKVIRIPRKRRHQCSGLWLLALNYAGRALTDGVLEEHELEELDARPADTAELVRIDLWHGHGHACERCVPVAEGSIVIHDFLVYNPSKAKVLSDRETERVRKASQRDKNRTPAGVQDVSKHPGPVPVPSPMTDIAKDPESGPVVDAGEGLDNALVTLVHEKTGKATAEAKRLGVKDLWALHGLLQTASSPMTAVGAVRLVEALLAKTTENIRDVDAYIATICRTDAESVAEMYFNLDIGDVA